MIFAALEYPETYEDMHDGLVAFVKARFSKIDFGLQGDSWIWIFLGDDKVAIDTFSSMKHLIKASRPGSHVDAVIEALRGAYTVRVYSAPELEPHEPDQNEERA
jgi:hypothetical protein